MEPGSSVKVALEFRPGSASIGQDAQLAIRVQFAVPANLSGINASIDQCLNGAIENGLWASSVSDLSGRWIEVSRVPERLKVANDVRRAGNGDDTSALASLSDEFIKRGVK
jgi:hypothetical protein